MAPMAPAVTVKMKSAIGTKGTWLPTSGFTLIELLVVMFIIAIVISITLIALGDMGKSRKAAYFAQQLKSTLSYAEGYAVVQPTTVIFDIQDDHYEFKMLQMNAHDDGSLSYEWARLNNPGSQDNSIPDDLNVELKSASDNRIHINSNGTMTPFTIRIGVVGETGYYLLTGNQAGELTLVQKLDETT